MASVNIIEYLTIASTGNASDFGDLTAVRGYMGGVTNGSRGVFAGDAAGSNIIDYVNITSTGNASDFGDLTLDRSGKSSVSNGTRGVWGPGGRPSSVRVNNIDYITIATTGDATDFGDATDTQHQTMASSGDA